MSANGQEHAPHHEPSQAVPMPASRPGGWPGRLAWLPIPLLIVAMAVVWAANLRTSYESRDLLLGLNFVFSTLASLFVAYLVARSFLASGTPGLLMLGCGVVLWGCAGFVGTAAGLAGAAPGQDFANVGVTIHNSCVWLSAVCHLTGVMFFLRPKRTIRAAGLALSAGYAAALGAVALVTLSALAHWTPIFIVQGQGGTLVRQLVLGSAVVMFTSAAALLIGADRGSPSPFTHWYGLALALIAGGLVGVLMEPASGSPLSWLGRAGQYVGGVYMLIAAVTSVRESQVWGVPLERALREERSLANAVLDTAGALIVVLDRQGRIVRFNRACEEATGYPAAEVEGRVFWDFLIPPEEMPGVKATWEALNAGSFPNEHENHWLTRDGDRRLIAWSNTALTNEGGEVRHIIATGIDVTEHRQAEGALREALDGLESRVKERTAELEQANVLLKAENEERLRIDRALRLEQARLDALLRLSQMRGASVAEMAGFILEHGIALTGSKIGFVGFLSEDEAVHTLHAVSKNVVKECNVTGDPVQWHVAGAGIWAEAIRERKTLFVNDYGLPHPRKKGLPPGHPPVQRFLVVPVFDGERIVAVAGMGNKASDYDKSDERQIALLLGGMWNYAQRNRAREALQQAHDELEQRVNQRTAELRAEITERERAEAEARRLLSAVQQEKDRLLALVKSIADEVWFADTQKRFTLANPSALREFSLDSADGTDVESLAASLEVYRPDGSPRPGEEAPPLRALKGEVVRNAEETVRTPASGELRHRQVSAAPVRDASGKIIGSVSVVRDITDQKRHEEQIAKLTRLYAVLSRVNESIVRTHDAKSLYRDVCRIVAEEGDFPLVWIGMTEDKRVVPAAWSGTASGYVREIKVEVDGELGMGPTGTCVRQGRAVVNDDFATNPFTSPWRKAAERYGFRASAAFPLRREGKAVGALTLYASRPGAFDPEQVSLLEALSADVSYALDAIDQEKLRNEAEGQLRETRDYLEHLLDYANAPIIVWAPDLTITRFNHAFERLTGRAANEVLGQRLEILFPEGQRAASMERIMRTLEGEFWEMIEIPILQTTGRIRHLLWNSANILGADGRSVVATIAQGIDITERNQAEAALKELNESLEQRVALRTAEIRHLAEQLRALAAELTLTEQRERRRLAVMLHDHLQQLLAAAKFRLMPLKGIPDERVQADVPAVEELLNQSIRASRTLMAELSPAAMGAADFTGAVEWLARWMKENQGLAVSIEARGEISLAEEDVRVLLFETIRELLFNVVKHAGVKAAAVRLARSESELEVTVSDEGAGFDPAGLHAQTGLAEGFGLFSIRERLDYMGGRMEIDSLPGKGSRVMLRVPIYPTEAG